MERLEVMKLGKSAKDVLVSFLQIEVAARVRGHDFLVDELLFLGRSLRMTSSSGPEKISSSSSARGNASARKRSSLSLRVRSSGSNWSSTNNGVATVSAGLVHGVSTDSATINAFIDLDIYGRVCGALPECPFDDGLQAPSAGDVCDFTITPSDIYASNCTGTSQNTNNFGTTVTPSGSGCLANLDQTHSSCSESSSGNIDFVVPPSPHCVYTPGAPAATVTYFAGPKLGDGTAGTISMTFRLIFGTTEIDHTDTATVHCP